MYFDIISEIQDIKVIAKRKKIRDINRLINIYGEGNWTKYKGFALIQLKNGMQRYAEIHWYEAHGKGKKEFKIKKFYTIQ